MRGARFISRDEIDDEQWNTCVRSDPFFRPYALTYYLDAVAPKWKAIIGPNYEWVWPLPYKDFPIHVVYQPLLAQQLGPYGKELTYEELKYILELIGSRNRLVRIKLNDRYANVPYRTESHTNVELALALPYSDQVKMYNRNAVSNLRKAEKQGLVVTTETPFNPWCLEAFRRSKGDSLTVLNAQFYQQVRDLYRAFESCNQAESYFGWLDGEVVAQVLILKVGMRLTLIFTATSEKARDAGAMAALIDHIVKKYTGADWVLDFEGSNQGSLSFFYKSFGGKEKVYLQAELRRLFWPLNRLIK